jgi:ABC-type branched-subunit amino acid transport system permease subunit
VHVEQKLKKIPVWFWLLLVALIILGLLVSPWFFVIAILGPFDEILFIIVLLLFIKAIRIVFFRKSDVTDKKTAIFSVLMLILVITSVFLFTVDIEALYEVSQNHEYYYDIT